VGRSYCFAKSRNIWATTLFVKWDVAPFCVAPFCKDKVWLKSLCIDNGKDNVAALIPRPMTSIVGAGEEKGAPTLSSHSIPKGQ
jgi:hypothetical protein